jgi:hypothetical protein
MDFLKCQAKSYALECDVESVARKSLFKGKLDHILQVEAPLTLIPPGIRHKLPPVRYKAAIPDAEHFP